MIRFYLTTAHQVAARSGSRSGKDGYADRKIERIIEAGRRSRRGVATAPTRKRSRSGIRVLLQSQGDRHIFPGAVAGDGRRPGQMPTVHRGKNEPVPGLGCGSRSGKDGYADRKIERIIEAGSRSRPGVVTAPTP